MSDVILTQDQLEINLRIAGEFGELNREIDRLSTEGRVREDAMYRFMRHIQDQIEKHAGWMQFDFYVPQIDAYEYNQFVEALGDKGDHARWSELLERYSAQVEHGSINSEEIDKC